MKINLKYFVVKVISALMLTFFISACSADTSADINKNMPLNTETPNETESETVLYKNESELSISDDLLIKPEEDFSGERNDNIEMIVLHFSSAVMQNKTDPFDPRQIVNIYKDSGVSAHYLIGRDGEIYRLIPENRTAWHAGKGTFKTEKYTNSMNSYSIGIELAAIGSEKDMSIYLTHEEYAEIPKENLGYTDEQYAALKKLISDICCRYNIPQDREHIIGHDEYNPLKNDPGELFDWSNIF